MNRKNFSVLFALAVLMLSPAVHAEMFYVSALQGDDRMDGDATHPFKTLQRGALAAKAGDSVVVRRGDYAGFVLGWDNPQKGDEGAPITFAAQEGATIVSRNGKTPDGIDLEPGCPWVVITGFTIRNGNKSITRAGIRITGSQGVRLIDNTCQGAGTWGIFTSHSSNMLIENNSCSGSERQHGIYVSNSADNVVIRGNRCFDNAGCGIHLNGDLSQGDWGLIRKAVVENNVIHGNGAQGGSAINCDGVQDARITGNLIYDNHASGISLFCQDGAQGSKRNVVANNTIDMPADSRYALNIQNGSSDNIVFDNILIDANPAHGSIAIEKDCLPGFSSDYNILTAHFDADGAIDHLADWQKTSHGDVHSRDGTRESLFVDPGNRDYHLRQPIVGAALFNGVKSPLSKGGGGLPPIGALDSGAPAR